MTHKTVLRPYQEDAVNQIREQFKQGKKRVLLVMATGLGKTAIFSHILATTAERGQPSAMMVRGKKLVDQACQRLVREGVDHGVRQASHWNRRYGALIQLCSIDTLLARNDRPNAKLVVVDEAHLACSSGYREVLDAYRDAYILSVTATPWTPGGLAHLADVIVSPITMKQGTEQGYLVPLKFFAPNQPNLKGVRIDKKTADYVTADIDSAMDTTGITGDIVSHWMELACSGATLLFACSVRHSQHLAESFNANGIAAEHVDANVSNTERDAIIKRLETGKTKVVCSVGTMTTGVDIPCLRNLVVARPTRSLNLHHQICGRGTRLYPGKEFCRVIDHAGNVLRHGFPTDDIPLTLDGSAPTEKSERKYKQCEKCFCIYMGKECPECGNVPVPAPLPIPEITPGKLVEIEAQAKWENPFSKSPYNGTTRRNWR